MAILANGLINLKKRYFKNLRKKHVKKLDQSSFFWNMANKLCAHLQKNNVKNPTNHGYFGPHANELCTHLRKNISKRIEKKLWQKYVFKFKVCHLET